MTKGWRKEPARHSLASRGMKSTPTVKKVKLKKVDLVKTKNSISLRNANSKAEQLNDYNANPKKWSGNTPNPWEDVIYGWDDYDDHTTHEHDKHSQSDVVFLKNSNHVVAFNYANDRWDVVDETRWTSIMATHRFVTGR